MSESFLGKTLNPADVARISECEALGNLFDNLLADKEALEKMRDTATLFIHSKRDLSIAITHIEDAMMRVNRARFELNSH